LKTTNFQPYSKRTDLPRGTEVSGARGTPPARIDDEMDPMDGGRLGFVRYDPRVGIDCGIDCLWDTVLRGAAGRSVLELVIDTSLDQLEQGCTYMSRICLPLGSYQLFIIFAFPRYNSTRN
jgi:hypothetical protein